MSTNPDLDHLEAEHFLCPDCDRFAKHMPHCNECADPFPCRTLALIAKARRAERLEAELVDLRGYYEAAVDGLVQTGSWIACSADCGHMLCQDYKSGRAELKAVREEPDADI